MIRIIKTAAGKPAAVFFISMAPPDTVFRIDPNQCGTIGMAHPWYRRNSQTKGRAASHVQLTDGKESHSIFSSHHGVDVSLRRLASGVRARLDRGRILEPHQDFP